jgi:hypothetical protein
VRKIFISYRRAEAEYAAGALGRELRSHFGDEQVFRDKEDVGGGVRWRQEVLREIDKHSALLVLIGNDWANAKDAQGRRRLDNTDDPVRLEVADGLRDGAAIFPVLLENAEMPGEDELPLELRALAGFNALRLRDGDWQYDLDKIRTTLQRVGFKPVNSLSSPPPVSMPKKGIFGLVMGVIGSVLVVMALLVLLGKNLDRDSYIGMAILSIIGLVLGVIACREPRYGRVGVRILGIAVCVLAIVGFFAALGRLGAPIPTSKSGSEQTMKRSEEAAARDSVRADNLTPEPKASTAAGTLTSIPLLKGHAVIRYNPTLWQVDKTIATQPGASQYIHKSGEVWMKVTSERLPIGMEKLTEHSLAEIKNADPTAKVTRQGSQNVNGLNMAFREIDATVLETPVTYYIHYYADSSGYIQFIGWTYRSLLKEYRSTIEEFLEGFEVTDQLESPPAQGRNASPPSISSDSLNRSAESAMTSPENRSRTHHILTGL